MLIASRNSNEGGATPYSAELQWIESTGTQYINTGIFPKAGITSVEFLFSMTALATLAKGVFGARNNTDPNRGTAYNVFTGTSEGPNRFRVDWSYNASTAPYISNDYALSMTIAVGNDILAQLHADSSAEMLGTISQSRVNKVNCGYSMLLGSINTAGTHFAGSPSAKWKYLKIWEGDSLVQHLLPVIDKEGVACFYDNVTETFLYNAGTGDFIPGPRK